MAAFAFAWRNFENHSEKDELISQLPCDAKERDDGLRKRPRCENPLSVG